MYHFSQNQKGGVSPQFAILVSAIFLVIGGLLYLEGEAAYQMFDTFLNDIKVFAKL